MSRVGVGDPIVGSLGWNVEVVVACRWCNGASPMPPVIDVDLRSGGKRE